VCGLVPADAAKKVGAVKAFPAFDGIYVVMNHAMQIEYANN
jgi:hypothetical protein